MKITLILIFIILSVSSIHAQEEKSMVLSFGQGKITSPDYDNNKWGKFYSIDLDYNLTKRQVLTTGFGFGSHRFYWPFAIGTLTISGDGTNANQDYYAFCIGYKYKFLSKNKISASIGAGAAFLIDNTSYPEKMYSAGGGSYENTRESSVEDLVFPVRLDIEYKLTKRVRIGAFGGVYVQPDYPIMTHYASLKLGILLK